MKSVDRFLDNEGRLTVWPAKHTDKTLALEYIITKFEPAITYDENAVNEILKTWHTFVDWPLLRRSLVDAGYLNRDRAGTIYTREF